MPDAIELARRIAGRLAEVGAVVAVATRESRPQGSGSDPGDSARGLTVYYYPEEPPAVATLDAIAREVGGRLSVNLAQLASLLNQSISLEVAGRRVDLVWRDLDGAIDGLMECLRGLPGPGCQHDEPGDPTYLHGPSYVAELHYARVLFDRDGVIRALKKLTEVYPEPMRRALVGRNLREGSFSLQAAAEAAGRGDVDFVLGRLHRSTACLIRALYALNGRYYLTEKSAANETDSFPLRPPKFSETVASLLTIPEEAPAECLQSRLELARALVATVTAFCEAHLEPVAPGR